MKSLLLRDLDRWLETAHRPVLLPWQRKDLIILTEILLNRLGLRRGLHYDKVMTHLGSLLL